MGTKHKEDKINYCKWCGLKTNLEPILTPETPLLEFLEEKINTLGRDKVWGDDSNWAILDIDSEVEAELLVYDDMLNTLSYKHLCEKCIEEDDILYDKYYEGDDGVEFTMDGGI